MYKYNVVVRVSDATGASKENQYTIYVANDESEVYPKVIKEVLYDNYFIGDMNYTDIEIVSVSLVGRVPSYLVTLQIDGRWFKELVYSELQPYDEREIKYKALHQILDRNHEDVVLQNIHFVNIKPSAN